MGKGSIYQTLRTAGRGVPQMELGTSVARGPQTAGEARGNKASVCLLQSSFPAGDSQWWESGIKSIQATHLGWIVGGEGCRVDLEGPRKLASHPSTSHFQIHTACIQAIFST